VHVLATAGHVDHGKSTLVRALTGMEPDRWAEERRRGMTLDLGFAWTTLGNGQTVAFVDVPGHERFIPTMLAGVGPVPGVVVVVAADEGWSAQTTEHVTVLDSLGILHGLLAVTRSDLADPGPALTDGRARLARTSLCEVEAVAVSAVTGEGLPRLREALERLVKRLPQPVTEGRVRLFIDRAFTIRGSGTVVTGTLGRGSLRQGDRLLVSPTGTEARIRGLESLGQPLVEVSAVARVAANLRGVPVDEVHRGQVLVTPGAWATSREVEVRLSAIDPADLSGDLMLHIGSAAVPCQLRPLGEDTARALLSIPLPLEPGDRAVLRQSSSRLVTGLVVLDVDPPWLRRRGGARKRGEELRHATGVPDPRLEVARRGAAPRAHLAAVGVLPLDAPVPEGLRQVGNHLVDTAAWERWGQALVELVDAHHAATPLEAGVSLEAARRSLGLPDIRMVEALVRESGGRLTARGGRVARPGSGPAFSEEVRRALEDITRRLEQDPLAAPEAQELAVAGLTKGVLAAAASAGLILRLPGEVILHPSAPEKAAATIAQLEQPFTLSQARQALGTTRRVAVPLLEHLDTTSRTVRIDATLRRVQTRCRGSGG
jgi:selenocysteine-specific elongation factor